LLKESLLSISLDTNTLPLATPASAAAYFTALPSPLLHHAGGSGTPAMTPIVTHRRHAPFFFMRETLSPFASSHHDSRSPCRCRKSHGRRGTPPSTPATNGSVAGENPTPRIVSFLASPPTREMAVIAPVIRHHRASHTATGSANVT